MRVRPDGSASPDSRELLVVALLALLVMAAAVTAFFGMGILTGEKLFFTNEIFGSDFWHLNYPFRSFYAQGLLEGRLPLWCPDLGLGYPLLADGQVSALYPPNLLLYLVLPLPAALNWELLVHLILGGVFAGMFARQARAGRGGSVLAALVYGLSGFFLVHLKHANMVTAGAWFPLLLLLMERYAQGRRTGTLALLAAAVGASMLGGHPQVAYNNLLMAAVYGIWLLVRSWWRAPEAGGGVRGGLRLGAGLLFATLLGTLLAGPQLLPAYELKNLGPREGGLSDEEATRWEYGYEHLLGFVLPKAFGDPGELRAVPAVDPETGEPLRDPGTGDPLEELVGFDAGEGRTLLFWEMTAYVGLLPLLLAIPGVLLGRPRSLVLSLLVLVALAVLLALGKGGGVVPVFRRVVPGFDLFRFPSRFLLYADFGLAVLAGIGLTRLAALFPPGRSRAALKILTPLVLLVCFLDLWLALGDHNPKTDAGRWTREPPTVRRIRSEEGKGSGAPFRIATVDPGRWVFTNAYHQARGWKGDLSPYEAAWSAVDPNLSLLFGLDNIHMFSPNAIDWTTEATHLLFLPPHPETGLTQGVNPRIAAIFNVRYFVDPFAVLLGRLPPVAEFPGGLLLQGSLLIKAPPPYTIRLYRNPHELPRAFLVPRARLVEDRPIRPGEPSPAQVAMLSPDFDPRREVLISGRETLEEPPRRERSEPVERPVVIAEYAPHRVQLLVDAAEDCWLFLSDAYYPGWVAEVDGDASPIHRANIAGRAVRIAAGRHEVVFTYRPASFAWGLACTALALLLLATLPLHRRLVNRGRRAGDRSRPPASPEPGERGAPGADTGP
ncbi:MAG: YfhO family protein [Planctomycetota bacterium]|jgi:hypothetical protein